MKKLGQKTVGDTLEAWHGCALFQTTYQKAEMEQNVPSNLRIAHKLYLNHYVVQLCIARGIMLPGGQKLVGHHLWKAPVIICAVSCHFR